MQVLIACEHSGVVRRAFHRRGVKAWSCDLKPADDGSPFHIQGDVIELIESWAFDLIVAHPPCDYLAVSGLHWNKRRPGRQEKTEESLRFVARILNNPAPRKVLENPVGCITTRIEKRPDGYYVVDKVRPQFKIKPQWVQPYDFGHDASKKTGLILDGVQPLKIDPAKRIPGRIVNGVERWANQTDSGQNRLGPSEQRATERAITYEGIGEAIVEACLT